MAAIVNKEQSDFFTEKIFLFCCKNSRKTCLNIGINIGSVAET